MRIAILVTALALAGCATVQPPRAPGGLKIAAWNIEHLAAADGEGCKPRTDADYAVLAAYAEALDADVIALQEVQSEAAARRVFPANEYDIVMNGQPYPPDQGTCGQNAAQKRLPQRTGFAIRRGVGYTVNPSLQALDTSDIPGQPVRWGADVTIAGPVPVRLLSVHLKSGCSSGNDAADDDCPILMRQVPVIESWIAARETNGEAFAVLGDFNRRLGPQDAQVWSVWQAARKPGAGLRLAALDMAGGPHAPRCDGGRYKEFIDHIVLSQGAFAVTDPSSFSELVYAERGEAMPSDHCPVSVTLRPPAPMAALR
jgi:endonuclease/exonuclease/phosphatase family metal-dependent hydrolase